MLICKGILVSSPAVAITENRRVTDVMLFVRRQCGSKLMSPFRHGIVATLLVWGMVATAQARNIARPLVISTGEFPPFVSERPGQSYLTEVLDAAAQDMGVRFIYRFMPWKRCLVAVEKGRVWASLPCVKTPEREERLHFSQALYRARIRLFRHCLHRQKQIKHAGLQDLRPYLIGGIIGYYYTGPLKEAGLSLELVAEEVQNLEKLAAGRIDLAIMNETVGWHLIHSRFTPERAGHFCTLDPPLFVHDVFMAVSKAYPHGKTLLQRFDLALARVKSTGIYGDIVKRHNLRVSY